MFVKFKFWLVFLVIRHVSLSNITRNTFEELQTWQDILDDEVVEILSPEDLEEIPETQSDKDNRLFGLGTPECPVPPNFPFEIPLTLRDFQNWSEDLLVSNVWSVQPRNTRDVVDLANWAYVYGYKLRPKGFSKSWAPLTVTRNTKCSNTIMVDTTKHLTQMKMISSKTNSNLRAIHVQAGASMENMMAFLEQNDAGLYAAPVLGESTIGGVLAVGGHGVGTPRKGVKTPVGYSSGSLSNLILSFKAVVWDTDSQSYKLKKFTREHPDAPAFLTSMGRAFLTEARLMVGPAYNMRCESRFEYNSNNLLGKPTSFDSEQEQETLRSLIEKYNSVDLSVYPYSNRVWAILCSNSSRVTTGSTVITKPFPFYMNTELFPTMSMLKAKILSGFQYLSPLISKIEFQLDMLKVKLGSNEDIWGTSNNVLLRYRDSFRRSVSSGYAIITTRDRVQKVTSDFYTYYAGLLEKYQTTWRYPQNEALQISVTGLDTPMEVPGIGVGNFEPPSLSFLSRMDEKNYDTAVMININALHGTRNFESFMRELETYMFLRFDGQDGVVRPEWAKAWGFTDMSAWENRILLKKMIPASFGDQWTWALEKFDQYDPYNVFSNDFLDLFLKANSTLRLKVNK